MSGKVALVALEGKVKEARKLIAESFQKAEVSPIEGIIALASYLDDVLEKATTAMPGIRRDIMATLGEVPQLISALTATPRRRENGRVAGHPAAGNLQAMRRARPRR